MRQLHAILLLLLTLTASLHPVAAGTITGMVRAQGKEGVDESAGGGKYDSRKFKFAEKVVYTELRDFVVYIEGPVALSPTNAAPMDKPIQVLTARKINQKGAMFSPHVLPVMVGATVEWPNQDEILHNVFSISDPKPFDLGLYKHPEIKRITFDKAGRVDAFCSIHKAMHCVILVLENPHFVVIDEKGRYTIPNVPAGSYKLKAWHERLPSQVKEITVLPSGETHVDFVLGITGLPKY